jgi:hypothetical protein
MGGYPVVQNPWAEADAWVNIRWQNDFPWICSDLLIDKKE